MLPTAEQIESWHEALMREPMMRRVITAKWQTDDEALVLADVGWDPVQERYTFPVYEDSGDVVQVIYRDLRKDARVKTKTHPGVTGSHVYAPFGIDDGRRVVLCAGEHDVFTAHAAGLNAVCFTNGEASVPPADRLEALRGRQVVVAYDADAAGQRGAAKVAAAVAQVAKSVAVADLSALAGLPAKGDVADVLALDDGERLLREVLEAAVPWEGPLVEVAEPAEGPQPVDWVEFWATEPEPIQYLVEPLIAHGEVTRVYAQAKVGKSLLIQEAAAALALGRKVLGAEAEQTDVLYIDQENTWDDWKTRLADMGYGPDDNWSRFHWYSLQSWPALDTASGGDLLVTKVQEHGAGLVVIDTQSKVLDGEEDKAPTSAAFYRHTLLPLKRLGVAVVIIDHAGNDANKPRGSSGKRDDVDVVWQASVRATDKLTLKRTHSRKRHAQDLLYVNRLLKPLRHEIASEDERDEEMIDTCVDAISQLEPRPPAGTSGRQIEALLKEAGKGFRAKTVREAWKRIRGEDA